MTLKKKTWKKYILISKDSKITGFPDDSDKLFITQKPIFVLISFLHYFLAVLYILPKLFSNSLKVSKSDFSSAILIIEVKGLLEVLLRITIVHSGGHEFLESLSGDDPFFLVVLVEEVDHLGDLFFVDLVSKAFHTLCKCGCVDVAFLR